MKKTQITTWIYIAILSVFASSNCMGAVDGALSKIASSLNVSNTTALYVGSIASLSSMISSLLIGSVLGKKLPYKTAAICCSVTAIIGGSIPFFSRSFLFILATRALFGIGLGGLMSLQNPLVTRLVEEEKRATILGIGTSTGFTVQCVLQLLGGVLADIKWNYVFLVYLLLIIPLLIIIAKLPVIELDPVSQKQSLQSALPLNAILLCVIMGIVGLNVAPLLFGSAFYTAEINNSAAVAAMIAMMFSVGCMAGGLLFPILYRVFKGKALCCFLLMNAAGLIISATANNLFLLGLGFFIAGVGNACLMAYIMMILGLICKKNQVAFASALMMAFLNLGSFICSSWEALIGRITGDSLYMPLYIGTGILVTIAVMTLFWSPDKRKN